MSSKLGTRRLQIFLLGLGVAVFLLGVGWLATLPLSFSI